MPNLIYHVDTGDSSMLLHAQEVFNNIKTVKEYAKNQSIYRQGDHADCFYYIKKGQAKVFLTSPDGMEKTLKVVNSGNILGDAAFFDKEPRVSSAKAVTKAEIISINHKMLMNLFSQHPMLAMEILTLQAKTIRLLSNQIDNMTFMQADSRIAQLLLQSYQTKNGENTVTLTHEEIGHIVGVSRVTVSKLLNTFRKDGLIRTQYRSIILTDLAALQTIADI